METILQTNPVLLAVLVIWSLLWKGPALWKAAHQNDKLWFIGLLVINTAGLLEILYLFFFSQKQKDSVEEKIEDNRSI